MIAITALPEVLLRAVPEFRAETDEHVADYGEVLLHVLFGALTRFVLEANEERDVGVVERTLEFLEQAWVDGDEEVRNLVAVSFVENVQPWDPSRRRFIESWPPGLRAEAERQRNWRPG
jgi:hypothetical protein